MSDDPLVGQLLHDTHEVVRKIGQGGMGSVYEAVHKRLRKQKFAIKVLHQKMVENETVFARFQREAEIATEIGHPNIISVVDFYDTDDGQPCMVMEFLEGEDLGERIKRKGKLTPHEVVDLLEQVGGALQAVHEKGVTHRDLKPANIFMVKSHDGSMKVKVLDFGISKIRDSGTLTGDQAVLGTPHYMSPEQGEGAVKDVDHRTDIFALGTISYQVLSGKIPFDAPTLIGVIRSICDKPHQPVTAYVPGLSKQVDAVLNRALAKKKEDRYQRVGDFVAALTEALDGCSPVADVARPARGAALDQDTVADEAQETRQGGGEGTDRPPRSGVPADPHITNVMGIDEVLADAKVSEGDAPVSPYTTLSGASGEQATEARRIQGQKKKRSAMALAGAAVVVLVAGGIYLATRGPSGGATETAPVVASPARAPEPAPPEPTPPGPGKTTPEPKAEPSPKPQPPEATAKTEARPAAPQKVFITLRLTPAGARVLLDGKPRSENPLVLEKNDEPHKLRVEAGGFLPRERDLVADADRTVRVALKKIVKPVRRPTRKVRRSTRKVGADDDEEGFSDLEAPKPKPKPRPKKKTDDEAFDNL